MSYQTSWQGSDVQITFEGRVVFDDILEADNLLYGDPRFDTMKYTLFDLIKVEKFDVSKREAEEIAALDSASRYFKRKAEKRKYRVFIIQSVVLLDDFYVVYELNAYTSEVSKMFNTYSEIYKNILARVETL